MNITAYTIFGTPIGGQGGGTSPPSPTPEPELWTRPADWLDLPEVVDTDSIVTYLYRVSPETTYTSVEAAGNYTVDWGDGAVENISSGVTAHHAYDLTTLDTSRTTLDSEGYLQVIVTITPQAGATLTSINLNKRHPSSVNPFYSGITDLCISGPSLTSILIGSTALATDATNIKLDLFKQVRILSNVATSFNFVLAHCEKLESVPVLHTASATNVFALFAYDKMLERVCDFDTSGAINCGSIFYECHNLKEAPSLNLSSATDVVNIFYNCYELKGYLNYNIASSTSIANFIYNCYKVQGLTLTNTGNVTSIYRYVAECKALRILSLDNCGAITNITIPYSRNFNVESLVLTGIKQTVDARNMHLTASALNALYSSLAIHTGTVHVTGNPGVYEDDPTIATAKGWTVTG